jgi:hypothetical protein
MSNLRAPGKIMADMLFISLGIIVVVLLSTIIVIAAAGHWVTHAIGGKIEL